MTWRGAIGSLVLVAAVAGTAAFLYFKKQAADHAAAQAITARPEPMESATVAPAKEREYQRESSAIGTLVALQSITARNEVAGRVVETNLAPGQVVEAGAVLVKLDVSVEEAELKALEAQSDLASATLARLVRARDTKAATEMEVDRARAEKDVATANIAQKKAVIARRTLVAPFRARVGMTDVHVGQYLNAGTELTTLQGVEDSIHVDFSVAQAVAEGLRANDKVEVVSMKGGPATTATIVAIDAKIDPTTRNAMVRAEMPRADLVPGGSVRVRIPVGPRRTVVTVPVSALRKGPSGDHVFTIANGKDGRPRASLRHVTTGPVLGDDVVVLSGLVTGDPVAAMGSFKLREGVLVSVVEEKNGADTRAGGGG